MMGYQLREAYHMKAIIYMSDAGDFIAALVKNGIQFKAEQSEDKLIITFTGGF